MVGIAQLVEHLVVVQGVAGSSPVTHPKWSYLGEARGVTGAEALGEGTRFRWVSRSGSVM